jgi:hypothetical protein
MELELDALEQARRKRETARRARRLAADMQGANKARALAFADELEAYAEILEDQLVVPFLPSRLPLERRQLQN